MPALLSRPLAASHIVPAAFALALAVAAYCLAYSWLGGQPERLEEALAWSAVNVLPWFLAFEAAKRMRNAAGRMGALGAGLVLSTGLGIMPEASSTQIAFEAVRHIPPLLFVAGLLWLGGRKTAEAAVGSIELEGLPLPPDQIERVEAAGNYVEIRQSGGVVLVHRAPLAVVECELVRHGFVRIHRSHLVRRDAIARIRTADVILRDGTSLKIGKRFRTRLLD